VESVEFGDEVLMVSVAAGHSLESTDLVVDPFEGAAGDGEVVPVQNSGAIAQQQITTRTSFHDERKIACADPSRMTRSAIAAIPDAPQFQILHTRRQL